MHTHHNTNERIPQEPLVSIIIPTYNRSSYLKEAIESVLSQTYTHFELIIVDDGSTDNTEEVIRQFNDTRIIYIKKPNEGHPGKTRNAGLRIAQGDFIAFLDDDDKWLPEKLKEQIGAHIRKPRIMASYTFYSIIGKATQRDHHIFPAQIERNGFLLEEMIRHGSFVLTSTMCFRKEVFDRIGEFAEIPNLRSGQDFDMWLRIAQHFEYLCIPHYLTVYRLHSRAISETFVHKRLFAIYERVIKNAKVSKHLKKNFLANAYFIDGEYRLSQHVKGYRKSFLKALFLNPFSFQRYGIIPLLFIPMKMAKSIYIQMKYWQKRFSLH